MSNLEPSLRMCSTDRQIALNYVSSFPAHEWHRHDRPTSRKTEDFCCFDVANSAGARH